jgi:hypothetical protein
MWPVYRPPSEIRSAVSPSLGRFIATVRIDCPLSAWIPDWTHCEAIRAFMTSCAALAFPNKRHSRVLASPEATVGFPKAFVREVAGRRAAMKLTRLGCVVGYG